MALFTQPVKDYAQRRDRKAGGETEGGGPAGAAGEAKKS